MADFARLACRRATLLPLKKGKKENKKKRSLRKKMTVFLSSLLEKKRNLSCILKGSRFVGLKETKERIYLFQRTDEKDNE